MYRYINASDGTLCIYVFMHFLHKYEHLCTKNLCIYVFGIAPMKIYFKVVCYISDEG